ncbi:hypothetical protein H8B19_06885 [Neptunicella marina]|uniref:Amino acid transport protein n=1 Tax=Neptunicella marina TaxID=2125989 RepID=A0A8J6IPS3_9ALTE|nr:hypothetical protein [Neptunicella marina]
MDSWTLILGVIFSSIGLGYFIYGKRQQDLVVRLCGLALMLYPYFFDNHWVVLIVGVGLMVIPRYFKI